MCLILESLIQVESPSPRGRHRQADGARHQVLDLVERADWLQLQKYVIQNVAHSYGKTATFMPKPIVGDNGSGMHVHQSVWKGGKNLFAGDGYAGLSEFALFYIGGIIKHARALNAITNPGTNSYKRLVPGFRRRSSSPTARAIARHRCGSPTSPTRREAHRVRFPDPQANPWLRLRGDADGRLDGVENKIHPGEAATKDLYHLLPEEDAKIPTVCSSLDQALDYLDKGRAFLTKGGVFTDA
jgi:glutamine synthetase